MSEQLAFAGFGEGPPLTDNLFFAIQPDAAAAPRIAQLMPRLRDKHGLRGRPIPPGRLHVSVHHVGEYPGYPKDIAKAIESGANIVDCRCSTSPLIAR